MRAGVSKRAGVVLALASLFFSASLGDAQTVAPTQAQTAAQTEVVPPLQCLIETVATIDVRTSSPRRRRRRTMAQIEHLEARRIVFEPITTSLARVRTLEGDPPTVGDARQPWTMYVAVPFEVSGVHVAAGAEVLRFAVQDDALVANLSLGNGVELLTVRVPCASLTLQATAEASIPVVDVRQPRRRARAQTVSIRARGEQGIEAVRMRVPRSLVWEELGRSEPFMHVRTAVPYATVDGWVYDTDMVQ